MILSKSNSCLFKSNPIFSMANDTLLAYQKINKFLSLHVKSYLFNGRWYFSTSKDNQIPIFSNANWYCLYKKTVNSYLFKSNRIFSMLDDSFINQNIVKLSHSHLFQSDPIFSVVNDSFHIKIKSNFLSFQIKSHLFSGKWYSLMLSISKYQ